MMQRTSAPPRGPRGASPSVRVGGRGGIQKRRGGTPRVDKDGDLVMDPAAAADKRRSGRGRIEGAPTKPLGAGRANGGQTRGGSLGIQKAQQAILRGIGAHQANVVESRLASASSYLKIDGLSSSKAASNPDGGLEALLAFLERKASGLDSKSNRTVKIKKSSMKGDSVIITASPEDLDQIRKLDQFSFAGATLSIQACEPPSPLGKAGEKKENVSKEVIETKDRFRAILAARYDAGLKLLNLSALGADPGLREMGVFNGTTTTSKIFPALMAVCDGLFKTRQEKKDAIVSVTLTDNELADVFAVTTLAQTFPDIKNLDLSRNKFTDLKGLDGWRFKFRHLENLVLAGNPLESQIPTLKDELLRRYPVLQVLNGIPVRTPEEITAIHVAADAAKSPIPISGPDFRDVAQVGENFIRQFIPLYDNDRATLLTTFYDAQSIHSVSVNMSAPRGASNPVSTKPWGEWVPHSRNLVKLTRLPARMSRLYRGSQAIQNSWSILPTTRHPDLQTQGDKYLIECHPLPGLSDPSRQSAHGVDGLIITIHGEFEEEIAATSEKTLRSFSRTFVLGPGAPGGLPIRIVSDMLVARAWAPLALPQTSSSLSAPQPSTEQQQQQVMAMQLMERTGMTMEFAVMCLRETGWDLEKAFIAFNKTKDALPPHAFSATVAR